MIQREQWHEEGADWKDGEVQTVNVTLAPLIKYVKEKQLWPDIKGWKKPRRGLISK